MHFRGWKSRNIKCRLQAGCSGRFWIIRFRTCLVAVGLEEMLELTVRRNIYFYSDKLCRNITPSLLSHLLQTGDVRITEIIKELKFDSKVPMSLGRSLPRAIGLPHWICTSVRCLARRRVFRYRHPPRQKQHQTTQFDISPCMARLCKGIARFTISTCCWFDEE